MTSCSLSLRLYLVATGVPFDIRDPRAAANADFMRRNDQVPSFLKRTTFALTNRYLV